MPRDDKFIISPAGTKLPVFDPAVHINGKSDENLPLVLILPATAFPPEDVRWLWPNWLARGKFHILAGVPGTGKTTLALTFAAIISRGGRWPDGPVAEAGDVLIWSGEDDINDTLVPRLLVAGADLWRVHFVTDVRERGKPVRPFDPATDMLGLVETAKKLPNLRLIVLDPFVSAVTGNSHNNTETRRGLQPVVDLAQQLDAALVGISHYAKGSAGRDPLERIAGSLAFGAVPRVALGAVESDDKNEPNRLVRVKNTNGPVGGGFAYKMFGASVPECDFAAQRIDWGEALEGSARDLMAVEQPDDTGDALEDAEAFLLDMLRDGPVATKEIRAAASAHGHKPRTVDRAKQTLNITATKAGFGGGWAWKLPEPKYAKTDEVRHDD